MTLTTISNRSTAFRRSRLLIAVTAGAAMGITGAFAVASERDDAPVTSGASTVASAPDDASADVCPPTEADLLRAADAARILEAQRPDIFAQGDHPATYDDLRLAAEWARRLEVFDPRRFACQGR